MKITKRRFRPKPIATLIFLLSILVVIALFFWPKSKPKICIYYGVVKNEKGQKLKDVEIVITKNGKIDSERQDSISDENMEFKLTHPEEGKYPFTKTDSSGKFQFLFMEKHRNNLPKMTIEFRKEGFRNLTINVDWNLHENMEYIMIKDDSK